MHDNDNRITSLPYLWWFGSNESSTAAFYSPQPQVPFLPPPPFCRLLGNRWLTPAARAIQKAWHPRPPNPSFCLASPESAWRAREKRGSPSPPTSHSPPTTTTTVSKVFHDKCLKLYNCSFIHIKGCTKEEPVFMRNKPQRDNLLVITLTTTIITYFGWQ